MPWMLLTPREAELVKTTVSGDGEHAELLRTIQGKLKMMGCAGEAELDITGAEWVRVQSAARNWRLGYERAFKALIEAGLRHI